MLKSKKNEPVPVQVAPNPLEAELVVWQHRAELAEARLAELGAIEPVAYIQGGGLHFTEWIKNNHPSDMLLYPVAVPAKE